MRAPLILLLFLTLAACARPLTPNETVLARAMFGDTLDTDKVKLSKGLLAGSFTYKRRARPRVTCSERLYPPIKEATVTVSPGAMAIFHRVKFREDLYHPDFMAGFPNQITLPHAMLLAHELTHVWQWQNRKTTGYHPLKAASEHSQSDDPYLFETNTKTSFLDHGFEQQGAIVEEYLCCRTLAPKAKRTKRLHAMLSQSFPVADLDRQIARSVILPWDGVTVPGICD